MAAADGTRERGQGDPPREDLQTFHAGDGGPTPENDRITSLGPGATGAGSYDVFDGVAAEYARHRPGIPAEAVRILTGAIEAVTRPMVLDLGTGTGQVPLALLAALPRIAHVDLVDVSKPMLRQAAAALRPVLGRSTAGLFFGEADAFVPSAPGRRPDLITCCRAFHWMNRPAVLAMADRVAAPHATVAIMNDGSLWTHESDWTAALRELIQGFLGPVRRAGTRGAFQVPSRRYEEDLAESAFSDVTEHRIPVDRVWAPDDVIGYLRTTSFARPDLFAGRRAEFESQARALLAAHADGGVLHEEALFTVLLARRPHTSS
ncbi:class I SAM-dependent methyltransferase [Streptomyces sp. NPDC047022]|uniref:class I SAM-dependent methyltransferase n=1 Tax=Streptomyces sp. NPDC047022 TaxID=3155737 RepID=UPI0033FC7AB7